MICGCFVTLCTNIYKPQVNTSLHECRVNIAISLTLKILSFVSNSTVDDGIMYGGLFLKTSTFQNGRGYPCADVIIFCVKPQICLKLGASSSIESCFRNMSPRCCYYYDVMPQSRKYRTALVQSCYKLQSLIRSRISAGQHEYMLRAAVTDQVQNICRST